MCMWDNFLFISNFIVSFILVIVFCMFFINLVMYLFVYLIEYILNIVDVFFIVFRILFIVLYKDKIFLCLIGVMNVWLRLEIIWCISLLLCDLYVLILLE